MLHQPPPKLYWCTSHRRLAEEIAPDGRHRCKRGLSGILLPCDAVEYTLNVDDIARRKQELGKADGKFVASLEIGEAPGRPNILPIIYRRKCTSS